MEGAITAYQVQPLAIQGSDVASSNRLTMTLQMKINIKVPQEETWQFSTTRFADYASSTNLADVEKKLFDEIAPKYAERKGGYTRVIKAGPRRGDGAELAILELV